ncbi:MAG: response regulator transcription factor [Gaiellaceae bacterium]
MLQRRLQVGVLVVDDQVPFRQVARDVIEATSGFEALGEAASGPEALVLVDELDPELVLLDVRMPGMDGFETARRLSAAHPEAVIVLISIDDPSELSPQGVESCGARTLIRKQDFGTHALRRLWAAHGTAGRGPRVSTAARSPG